MISMIFLCSPWAVEHFPTIVDDFPWIVDDSPIGLLVISLIFLMISLMMPVIIMIRMEMAFRILILEKMHLKEDGILMQMVIISMTKMILTYC